MSVRKATPLFVDTGAFYAHFDERAARHERAIPTDSSSSP